MNTSPEEIVNRVASSRLVTFDLEELYLTGRRLTLDISQWLQEGFLLREKDFRESLKNHDWEQYAGTYVALGCSTDAIVPAWAYMLAGTYLNSQAQKVVVGNLEDLETILYTEVLARLDVQPFKDQLVIVKGCSKKPVPENAYLLAVQKLQPVVKSLMFGEACSSVPLYKRK